MRLMLHGQKEAGKTFSRQEDKNAVDEGSIIDSILKMPLLQRIAYQFIMI